MYKVEMTNFDNRKTTTRNVETMKEVHALGRSLSDLPIHFHATREGQTVLMCDTDDLYGR